VTLAPEIERLVEERVARGDFASADALVNQAVQRLIEEESEMTHTEALLREAAESGDYIELTEQEWDRIDREALEEVERRRAGIR
jgi:putative addiction module CopG family antidote